MILAFAGAPLMREYATASAGGKPVAATAFATIYRIVFFGMWQTMDAFPAGVCGCSGRVGWRGGKEPGAWLRFCSRLGYSGSVLRSLTS